MKYYRITCQTPFVGENNDYFLATDFKDELEIYAYECAYENGLEWYDEQTLEEIGMTEEEYYEECTVSSIEEITEKEYYENCPWKK